MSERTSIMLVAGEASGDLHGGALAGALKKLAPDIELFGIGGEKMRAARMELLFHADDLAYIGFAEVLKHWPELKRVFRETVRAARMRRPDLIVCIDYPGFNLRLAKAAHKYGLKTFYYIAPQVWAWGGGRVKKMAKTVDSMAVIFQFEEELFSGAGIPTHFVGHPLLEGLAVDITKREFCTTLHLHEDKPIIALLPGSRPQEIHYLLPVMAEVAGKLGQKHADLQVLVGKSSSVSVEHYRGVLEVYPEVTLVENNTYATMKYADLALVASGTATLETACFGTPFVVGYRVSPLSYFLMKRMITIENIGLVNIVAGKTIVPEFIQHNFHADKVYPVAERLLEDTSKRGEMIGELQKVKANLGEKGAAGRTARLILECANRAEKK